MADSRRKARDRCATATSLLEGLGFLVNHSKSQVQPVQGLTFLGLVVDSKKKTLSLPSHKVSEINKQVQSLLKHPTVSARKLAQVIGKLSATILAVQPAPLHYRGLQYLKHQALRVSRNYDQQIRISPEAKQDQSWWIHNINTWNGRCLQTPSPELEIETDASQSGWGAYCQGSLTGGRWSTEEKALHINELELLAALFSLKAFLKEVKHTSVLLKSDNTTTIAYINHLGGTKSRTLVKISKDLWSWCLNKGISLQAQYLPGKLNLSADFMSRHLTDRTDWILNPSIFSCLNEMWGPLEMDLFAMRFSHQLPRFFSWHPDPMAEATDAFSQDWRNVKGYAHPPWCLIARVLAKVQGQKASLVLLWSAHLSQICSYVQLPVFKST